MHTNSQMEFEQLMKKLQAEWFYICLLSTKKPKGLCKYTTSVVCPSISSDYFWPNQPISLHLSNKETDRSFQSSNILVKFSLKQNKAISQVGRSQISMCRINGTPQLYVVFQQHVGQLVPAASRVRASRNSWWRQAEESQSWLSQRAQSVIKSSYLHSALQRKKAALINKIPCGLKNWVLPHDYLNPACVRLSGTESRAFCPIAIKKLS